MRSSVWMSTTEHSQLERENEHTEVLSSEMPAGATLKWAPFLGDGETWSWRHASGRRCLCPCVWIRKVKSLYFSCRGRFTYWWGVENPSSPPCSFRMSLNKSCWEIPRKLSRRLQTLCWGMGVLEWVCFSLDEMGHATPCPWGGETPFPPLLILISSQCTQSPCAGGQSCYNPQYSLPVYLLTVLRPSAVILTLMFCLQPWIICWQYSPHCISCRGVKD